jgi:hypothetical protein
VFTSVVGLSPWGGRGLMCLPTNPFGERRQSEVEQWIAGPDLIFYHEYFAVPGLREAEFERDVRSWIEAGLYSLSALPPIPPQLANLDLAALSDEQLAEDQGHPDVPASGGTSTRTPAAQPVLPAS